MVELIPEKEMLNTLKREIAAHSRIVHCFRIDERSKVWNTVNHEHDFLEILYFIKGEAMVRGKDSHRSLTANDLIIYPPRFGHKEFIDFSRHQEAVCVGIELRDTFAHTGFLTISDVSRRLEWIFTELHRQYEMKESGVVTQLKYLLFSYMVQVAREGHIGTQSLTSRIQEYIHGHFREQLSQPELCELVNVSPSYLNRTFKADTGQTPIEFLNRVRIEEAANLMRKKRLTIEEVASRVGIRDPKYFSKVFKKITGFSPTEFRQLNP